MYLTSKVIISFITVITLFLIPVKALAVTDEIESSDNDSIPVSDEHTFSYKQLIIPGSLMLYGAIEASLAPKNRLLNYAIGHEVITHKPERFQIDDITQYVPAASVYALNLVGIKGKHNFKDRTIILEWQASSQQHR